MIAACKLEKTEVPFGEPPKKSFLLNIRTTGQGLENHTVCSSSHPYDTHRNTENTLNIFYPFTQKILKEEY